MAYLPQQIALLMRVFPVPSMNLSNLAAIRQGWFRRLTKHDEEHIKASLDSVGDVGTSGQAPGLPKRGAKATGCDCPDVCL